MITQKPKQNIIIFTDLDGTLLDHHSYDFSPALEMLDFCRSKNIPVVITTSKTLDEVLILQKKLNINDPFIIENGAGVCIPNEQNYPLIDLGVKYNIILKAFGRYEKEFSIKGFHQMKLEDVAQQTGLSIEDTKNAINRNYCEPFILEDPKEFIQLRQMARNDGFDIVKGGRFYHLITKNIDKANGIKKVLELYKKQFACDFKTIALGDGENDITMLNSVDIPILIPKYDGSFITYCSNNIIKAKHPGPKGWNEELKRILL